MTQSPPGAASSNSPSAVKPAVLWRTSGQWQARRLGKSWASSCHATKMQSSLADGHQSACHAL